MKSLLNAPLLEPKTWSVLERKFLKAVSKGSLLITVMNSIILFKPVFK